MPTLPSDSSNFPNGEHLVVRGHRVLTPEGERRASIHIRKGIIAKVSSFDDIPKGWPVYEAANAVHSAESAVMPGIVDTHVHINDPGRTGWEGFWTATRAAAAGGATTLIEMPLNSIPATTTVAAYRQKIAAAARELWVDVGFWGGVVPGNERELGTLWDAGVFGFKCFLVPSGVPEFVHVAESDLRAVLPELASMGAPLLAHAELPGPIEAALQHLVPGNPPQQYAAWLASRPRASEDQAISLLLRLSRESHAHVHIVHLSSSNSIATLSREKSAATNVTGETCPHYLTFTSEEIPVGATEFKCAPPIRERENRDKLWAALDAGTIDLIASDHSPCPPEMKLREQGDFLRAWGGIASLQVSLPSVWTEARARGYALTHIVRWMCEAPARLAGLQKRKGAVAVGCDADLVIFNPDAKFRVEPDRLHHRHKLTPYAGRELAGIVEATFVRGHKVFERGQFAAAPAGRVLRRGKQ
jgi:allantoinase